MRTLRSVSEQLFARGSCAASCCGDWGAGAGSTSLREPSAALVDPGGAGLGSMGTYPAPLKSPDTSGVFRSHFGSSYLRKR
eukprot:2888545-Amphidinium_carterae.1